MKPICTTAQTMLRPRMIAAVADRYEVDANGCWNWTGSVDRYGYGAVFFKTRRRKRQTGAHKASWIAHRGPVPVHLQLDHLCRNRRCVNPWHLEMVTSGENTRRSPLVGRAATGRPRTGCKRHGRVDGYMHTMPNGYTRWVCRTCQKIRMDRWNEKNAA